VLNRCWEKGGARSFVQKRKVAVAERRRKGKGRKARWQDRGTGDVRRSGSWGEPERVPRKEGPGGKVEGKKVILKEHIKKNGGSKRKRRKENTLSYSWHQGITEKQDLSNLLKKTLWPGKGPYEDGKRKEMLKSAEGYIKKKAAMERTARGKEMPSTLAEEEKNTSQVCVRKVIHLPPPCREGSLSQR